jgi:hypothetical protein
MNSVEFALSADGAKAFEPPSRTAGGRRDPAGDMDARGTVSPLGELPFLKRSLPVARARSANI